MRQRTLGANHPHLAASFEALATIYKLKGQPLDALEPIRKAIHIYKTIHGEEHTSVRFLLLASFSFCSLPVFCLELTRFSLLAVPRRHGVAGADPLRHRQHRRRSLVRRALSALVNRS